MDMRAKIEESGNDSRWEFDRKVLFEHSDYMSNVCQCVYDIAQVRETSISADVVPFVTLQRANICSDLKTCSVLKCNQRFNSFILHELRLILEKYQF